MTIAVADAMIALSGTRMTAVPALVFVPLVFSFLAGTGAETGALMMEGITKVATTVGFSNEFIHIYAAEELQAGEQCPDEDEFIHTVRVPLEEAVEMVGDGRIYDAKSIAAILLLAQHVNRE